MKSHPFYWLLFIMVGTFSAKGVDADFYGVIKWQQFYQTNSSAPVIGSNGYTFQSFVYASTNYAVTNATVKPSNSTPLRTLVPEQNGSVLNFEEAFTTQAALDTTYPAGTAFSQVNYSMVIQSVNDGTHSANLSFFLLFLPVSYPTTPVITNWPAAQSIDATSDFTLLWANLGGSTLAIVQLLILDTASNAVFASPAPFQTGALNGASNQYTIPAMTLPSGTSLIGHLTIANPGKPETNSYPGSVGVPALAKDTYFSMKTRPAPAAPVLNVRGATNGIMRVRLTGETNRVYHIEATASFQSVWTNVLTTNSVSGVVDYSEPFGPANRRFYRGRLGQ